MNVLQAVILGIIQGITEWLPISSKGHLALAQHILIIEDSIFFDVMLHLASILALFVIYRKDLWNMSKAFLKMDLFGEGKIIIYIISATIPIAIIGFFVQPFADALLSNMTILALGFAFTGAILHLSKHSRQEKELDMKSSMKIGLMQALALLPGVSRSGSTISMGMISGLKKEEAVRFSFLLAIPAILGATLLSIIKMGASDIDMMPLLIGMALSFFISLFAINLIRSLARGNKFHYFSYYCFFMAIVAFILSLKG